MLSLLGAIVGLVGSLGPRILGFFEARQNHRQELELLRLQGEFQMQMMEKGHAAKLAEINAAGDIQSEIAAYGAAFKPSGVTWIDGFNAFVRPFLALAFFFLYAAVKVAQYSILDVPGAEPAQVLLSMWGNEDWATWAAVITFYFGNRTFNKERGRG
jgi:hypothetical protein